MRRFAQDPHNTRLLDQIMGWHDTHAAAGSSRQYLLLDGSMLEPGALAHMRSTGVMLRQALQGTRFEAYGDAGPLLARLATDDRPQWAKVLQSTSAKPALSLLSVSGDDRQLLDVLGWLADVRNPDGTEWFCRFADSRVLPSLLNTLDDTQRECIARSIHAWAWVGRDGSLCTHCLRPAVCTPWSEDDAPFILEEVQVARMLQHSEADTLFGVLTESMPDLLPPQPAHVIHARLQGLLAKARTYGVIDSPDQMQYVTIALSTHDSFDEHKMLEDTWTATREGKARFSDLISRWPEEVWAALEKIPARIIQEN